MYAKTSRRGSRIPLDNIRREQGANTSRRPGYYGKSRRSRRSFVGAQSSLGVPYNRFRNAFADGLVTTLSLSYTANNTTSAVIGTVTQTQFILNSISNPLGTVSALQPIGYTALATIYRRYMVLKTSYHAEYIYNQTGGTADITIVNFPSLSGATVATVDIGNGQPRAIRCFIPASRNERACGAKYKLSTLRNQSQAQYVGDDSNEAYFGSSPSIPIYLNMNDTSSQAIATVYTYNIKMYFTVRVFDNQTLVT